MLVEYRLPHWKPHLKQRFFTFLRQCWLPSCQKTVTCFGKGDSHSGQGRDCMESARTTYRGRSYSFHWTFSTASAFAITHCFVAIHFTDLAMNVCWWHVSFVSKIVLQTEFYSSLDYQSIWTCLSLIVKQHTSSKLASVV